MIAVKENISLNRIVDDTVLRNGGRYQFNFSTNGPGELNGLLPILIAPLPAITGNPEILLEYTNRPLSSKIDGENGPTLEQFLNSELSPRALEALKFAWQIYEQAIGIRIQYLNNQDLKNDVKYEAGLIHGATADNSAYTKNLSTFGEDELIGGDKSTGPTISVLQGR